MINPPKRMVIHMKDIMIISGISERSARRLLYQIRKHYNKLPTDFVSIQEFCEFTKLKEEKVREYLN